MSTQYSAIEQVAIKAIGSLAPAKEIGAGAGADDMPLDQRVMQASKQLDAAFKANRKDVLDSIEKTPGVLGNPEDAFALQQKISDYSLEVALVSGLTRKSVAAVETLLRA